MNKSEARSILADFLERFRQLSYKEFARMVDSVEVDEVRGESGVTYNLEAVVVWDDQPGGVIRVMASVDDGGLRAFFPMPDDFLMGPDGQFIDE